MKYLLLLLFPLLFIASFGCKSVSRFPMDDPSPDLANNMILGKWRAYEDTEKNNFFEVTKSRFANKYHVKYWNLGGVNPIYESYVFFSKINNTLFLNVSYWDDNRNDSMYYQQTGYILVKIINADHDYNNVTTATVSDQGLYAFGSKLEVFNRVARNMNSKSYYSDTLHFYKMK
jgi:hypothetical protein